MSISLRLLDATNFGARSTQGAFRQGKHRLEELTILTDCRSLLLVGEGDEGNVVVDCAANSGARCEAIAGAAASIQNLGVSSGTKATNRKSTRHWAAPSRRRDILQHQP